MKASRLMILAAALALAPVGAFAQDTTLGKAEFDANCAVCHGASGKGDGPLAGYIKTDVPDLTALTTNNNGVFPSDRVHQIIDGRGEVAVHGPRDMPIWGQVYNAQAVEYYREVWQIQDPASIVRTRIDALVAYIASLQQ